jgi:hypothetical protein
MSDPVIVDDGGSTRIKHVRSSATDVGDLESLVNVQTNSSGIPQSSHTFTGAVGGFSQVEVVFIDQATGTSSATAQALIANDKVEIVSGPIKVTMEVGASSSKLTIAGTAAFEPVVESKQTRVKTGSTKRQRRYVVSNAPPIDTITLVRGTTSTPLFSAAGVTSVYTMAHFS